jgi:hypothetical protein
MTTDLITADTAGWLFCARSAAYRRERDQERGARAGADASKGLQRACPGLPEYSLPTPHLTAFALQDAMLDPAMDEAATETGISLQKMDNDGQLAALNAELAAWRA